jgi:hypothetical protein
LQNFRQVVFEAIWLGGGEPGKYLFNEMVMHKEVMGSCCGREALYINVIIKFTHFFFVD